MIAPAASAERRVLAVAALLAALIGTALIVALTAAFESNREAFWIWFGASCALLPADYALGRATGIRSLSRMTSFYAADPSLTAPQLRARIAVTFARLPVPFLVALFLNIQARSAIIPFYVHHPLEVFAAFILAAALGTFYVLN